MSITVLLSLFDVYMMWLKVSSSLCVSAQIKTKYLMLSVVYLGDR